MYRIEVAPGEETVFRTIEELAVGIRNGVITPRSRIYHSASQKWLPIGLHPHYKKAMELPAARAAQPAATPAAPVAPATPTMPRVKPRAEAAPEAHHEPKPAAVVPAPVTSPVVAMQQEVLRDLPVVAIPEPLPWATRAPEPAPRPSAPVAVPPPPVPPMVTHAPAPIARIAQAVQAQPTATVTYTPHVPTRTEDAHEVRPTARRAPRPGGRPFLLLGVAAVLVVGGNFALSAVRSASAVAKDGSRDAASEPAGEPVSDDAVEPDDAIEATDPAPRVSSASARVPMTPGPAFAGSAPLRPGETAPTVSRAAASTPSRDSATPVPAIAPPPLKLDIALPELSTDSVVPKRSGDTMAMKKILRALNGAKPETPASP